MREGSHPCKSLNFKKCTLIIKKCYGRSVWLELCLTPRFLCSPLLPSGPYHFVSVSFLAVCWCPSWLSNHLSPSQHECIQTGSMTRFLTPSTSAFLKDGQDTMEPLRPGREESRLLICIFTILSKLYTLTKMKQACTQPSSSLDFILEELPLCNDPPVLQHNPVKVCLLFL